MLYGVCLFNTESGYIVRSLVICTESGCFVRSLVMLYGVWLFCTESGYFVRSLGMLYGVSLICMRTGCFVWGVVLYGFFLFSTECCCFVWTVVVNNLPFLSYHSKQLRCKVHLNTTLCVIRVKIVFFCNYFFFELYIARIKVR